MSPLRITVAGKGGTGKTVIAASLARFLAREGRRVLAVDLDSNPMLAISLGVPVARLAESEPIPTDFWVAVQRPGEGRSAVLIDHPAVLAQRHAITAPDNVTLLAAPVVPNGGCTSDAGVRGMLGTMLGNELFEHVITDFEAGVDEPAWALGGMLNPADQLLVVATPTPVAIATARKIIRLATEHEIVHIHGIANQLRSEGDAALVEQAFADAGVSCVASIPFDEAIAHADVLGSSPLDAHSDSPALRLIEALARRLDRDAAASPA